jgi:NADH:ubiquinone oxidoreductase subunit 2 (subunit N)
MNYETLLAINWVIYYAALTIWAILIVALIWSLVKRRKKNIIRIIKFSINSLIMLVGWAFVIELALMVRAPVAGTKSESVKVLRSLIEHQFNDLLIAFVFCMILVLINLAFYYLIEKKQNKRDILWLLIFSILVMVFCIWFTGEYAFYGLMQDIDKHFGST